VAGWAVTLPKNGLAADDGFWPWANERDPAQRIAAHTNTAACGIAEFSFEFTNIILSDVAEGPRDSGD
jgi:hypothetical protein